jgi:hypothetical protein
MTDQLQSDFEAATEEWDNVQEIVPTFSSGLVQPEHEAEQDAIRETLLVTVPEVIQDFRGQDIELIEDFDELHHDMNPLLEHGQRFVSWLKCSCFQPRINENLQEEKKLVFAISKRPFDDQNLMHFHVLLTLYKQFTGSRLDCARYGSHWEQIGFQV